MLNIVIMALFSVKMIWAVAMLTIMTRVCHADLVKASAGGYCTRQCGSTSGVDVKYPFRLMSDAVTGQCYTNYSNLEFACVNKTLYLNVSNEPYMYEVKAIDYNNQTISLVPFGDSTCRLFDLNNFGGLTVSKNSTLLLDCSSHLYKTCQSLKSNYADACDRNASGISIPSVGSDRFACPYYATNDYSSCYLFEQDPIYYLTSPNALPADFSYVLELQFHSNKSLSFLSPPPSPPPTLASAPAPATRPSDTANKSRNIILGVLAGILSAIIIFLSMMLCWCRWSRRKLRDDRKFDGDRKAFEKIRSNGSGHVTQLFTYKELEHATQNFSTKHELGGGGFGTVYRGKLGDGRLVAVKKLNQGGSQGIQQFLNEVEVLSKVRHPHLVQLLGCCMERPLLVYEFVPNGSISNHLHGGYKGEFPWETRLEVAIQTAEALAYLHFLVDPPIFHRDVKTTNILLDKDFKVKIADFGLSRLVLNVDNTHISTAPQGTPGYLDPDYHESYHLSDKSDVYSFGVVLMELVTAKKAVDMARERKEINLASLAVAKIHSGCLLEIIDPNLKCSFPVYPVLQVMVEQVAELAFRCLASEKDDRPSMKEVLAELQRIQRIGAGEQPSSKTLETESSFDDKGAKPLIRQDGLWPPASPTSVQDVWVSNTTSPADSLAEMA